MDRAISSIVLYGALAAAIGTLPLALLYRRLTIVVFQEMVLAQRDPGGASPFLRTVSFLPLLLVIAWSISLTINDPHAIVKANALPLALWAASSHAIASILATRSFHRRCRDWRRLAARIFDEAPHTPDSRSLEEREREAEALMKAHP
jgi:hypothetical protein